MGAVSTGCLCASARHCAWWQGLETDGRPALTAFPGRGSSISPVPFGDGGPNVAGFEGPATQSAMSLPVDSTVL